MRQAAHDLANLLTVSNGHRQEAEKHLAKARAADEKAMELCRRMQAGQLTAPPGIFDINAVAGELVGAMEAIGGPLRLELRCARDPIFVAGDALSMHRALFNLCLNARNAGATLIVLETKGDGPEPGSHSAADYVMITIQDNGSGMAADMVKRLWALPVSRDGMHGHGLAIVKKTIEQHGGNVGVESTPNRTTFTIALPVAVRPLGTAVA